jgi:transposase-like protein
VWFHHRFTLNFQDIEELLAARRIVVSYEAIRQWCKSTGQAQRCLSCHGGVNYLFRLGRYLMKASHYRVFLGRPFVEWARVSCVHNLG